MSLPVFSLNKNQTPSKFDRQLIEKEKDAINRIDIARGTIAMQWEDKLLEEMARLKMELEQIGLEEKQEGIAKLRRETDEELTALTSTFTAKQEELEQEIASLKEMLDNKQKDYEELQAKSDTHMMETRQYLDRAERDNQVTLDREIRKRESIIGESNFTSDLNFYRNLLNLFRNNETRPCSTSQPNGTEIQCETRTLTGGISKRSVGSNRASKGET